MIRVAVGPCESFSRVLIHVHLCWLSVQPSLGIDLDPFKLCSYKVWDAEEIVYYSLAMLFGTFSPPNLHLYDPTLGMLMLSDASHRDTVEGIAFLIIVVIAVRSRLGGYISIPSILTAILRDATLYFLVVFSFHVLSMLFLFLTPVGGSRVTGYPSLCSLCVFIQPLVRFLPGMYVPSLLGVKSTFKWLTLALPCVS